jgi:hypothetical protein
MSSARVSIRRHGEGVEDDEDVPTSARFEAVEGFPQERVPGRFPIRQLRPSESGFDPLHAQSSLGDDHFSSLGGNLPCLQNSLVEINAGEPDGLNKSLPTELFG